MVDLHTHHERTGRAGVVAGGRTGSVGDPVGHGILDPAAVKREAIGSAAEDAKMILHIDDVMAAR